MNDGIHLSLQAWSAWAPGRETRAEWRFWAGADSARQDEAAPPGLPMMLRRRATGLGQRIIAAALACGDAAQSARYILASRHGELARSVGILDAIDREELPSPGEFSMSVHHGLAGLLSIHAGNRRGHLAVAAGRDSFGAGLLEAIGCLAECPEERVLLLYGDAPMPDEYGAFAEEDMGALPLAAALSLTVARPGEASIVARATPAARDMPPSASTALDFLAFALSDADRATSNGTRMDWEWRRAA